MTQIREPLFEAALISRHEPAILSSARRLLFYEFDELAGACAYRLREAGVGAGERIGILLETCWEYPVLLMAVLRAGAIACPLSTRLPMQALREQLALIRCTKLVAAKASVAKDLPGVTVLERDNLVTSMIGGPRIEGDGPYDMQRPATIVFTSGTSGRPRAVLHTVGNHYYSARGSNINIKVGSHDRWLLSLPLYHVGGLGVLFRCVLGGATLALPEPGEAPAEAQERLEATHLSMVPTQLYRLLKAGAVPPSFLHLKAILLGGGPVDPGLLKEALRRGLPVYTTYGLTEMTSQVTTMQVKSPPEKRCTSGLPLKHAEVRVSDAGEILVRGQTLCAGYIKGDVVVLPLGPDGWFATGDLGRLDADGYLTVTGRRDHMFISGGENIQPEEIEQALMALPGVEEACVVPVADAEFGYRPVAFIRGSNGALDDKALCAKLEAVLPRYKIPVRYLAWPAGQIGLKPDRAELARVAGGG